MIQSISKVYKYEKREQDKMEVRHLRYFATVAHKRHFTHAAEELFIAQPALSQQIQALERELGVTLFERTSRHVRLTPAGEALLVRAERILSEVEQAQVEMQAFAGVTRGRVTLGLLQSLGAYRLSALLARFHAVHEGIEMVLHEDVTEQLLEQVKLGQLDVALTHAIGDIFPLNVTVPHMNTEPIMKEEVTLVVSPNHPFAHQAHVSPKELEHEPFILFKPGSGLRQVMVHLSLEGGFTPHVLFESGDIGTIRALTAEGLGISILPQSVVEAPGKEIVKVKLIPPLPSRTIIVVWHRRIAHSLAATAFLAFLREDLRLHPWEKMQE